MPKMTLKEAQEVLEKWPPNLALLIFDQSKTQEIDSIKYPEVSQLMLSRWYDFMNNLLEAARVVERSKSGGVIQAFIQGYEDFGPNNENDKRIIKILKEIELLILSDNQESNV